MSKLLRKRIVFPIVGVLTFVISLLYMLVSAPEAQAATEQLLYQLTLSDILTNTNDLSSTTSQGSKGVWYWKGIKSFNSNSLEFHGDGTSTYFWFGIDVNSTDERLKRVTKYEWSFTASKASYGMILCGDYSKLNINFKSGDNKISDSGFVSKSNYFKFDIDAGTYTTATLTAFDIKLYYTPGSAATINAGTGIDSVFLSNSNSATEGSKSGTTFDNGSTVYSYAKLKSGYKAPTEWTYIANTGSGENTSGAIYRVGSKTINNAAVDFGTVNATPKTKTVSLNSNGGVGSGTINLTYDEANQAPNTGFNRELFDFASWNSKADGSGYNFSTELSKWDVNEIILDNLDTLYAKWKINAAGVETLIDNIGAIEFTPASKGRIKEARDGYDSLSDEEKKQVDNIDLLLFAEEIFNSLLERYAEVQIGDTLYAFMTEAFEAMNDGDTITLRRDVDLSNENIAIDKNVTLDLNGHTLTTTMEDGATGTPTLVVTSNYTVVELRNSKPATGGVKGFCIVDENATGSYVELNDCRLVLSADLITGYLSDINKVGPGYQIENINSDGSPDSEGYVSIVKPLKIFDISNLDEDYIVPDGQVLTGDLHNPVKISILDGATVTLKDLNINSNYISFADENFASITCLGDAELIIKGINDLFGFNGGAGIFVPEGHTLTIDGDGILYSAGRDGAAGIGGNANTNSGNIIINGGDINADGGTNAAGIGGGYSEHDNLQSGNITINGGRINSTAKDAAGIGSAVGEACGDITINGGVVEAKSSYSSSTGNCGSGIGSGKDGSCGSVAITDNVALVRSVARDNEKEIGGNCASLDIANTLTAERVDKSIYYYHKNTVIIDGQVVNDSNSSGEGWSYDKDTNTLTLDGYVYEGSGKVYSNFTDHGDVFIAAISYEGEDDFIINLIGENTIVVTQDGTPLKVCGIHSAGKESADIKFTGNGSLSISFTGVNPESYAIAAGSSVTIDGPTIVANGGNAIYESAGIYVRYDGLNVISGSLTATASECSESNSSYGIYSDDSEITIGENTKSVIASGYTNAIYADVINAIPGFGYTDEFGQEGETEIAISTTGSTVNGFKYVAFIGYTPSDVIELINNIGDVDYTSATHSKISRARIAYNCLDETEQAQITNYNTLLAAEEIYNNVDNVVKKIDTIGEVKYTAESKALIDAARSAYNALVVSQKELVPNYDTLLAKEAEYKALDDQAYADIVENVIAEIGEVKYTAESKALIDAARAAYDALNDEAKELVENKDVLFDAEKVYGIMDVINNLNGAEYTNELKELLDNAEADYNSLSDSQKELITNYDEFDKLVTDYDAITSVVNEIDNIGKLTYDEECHNKIIGANASKNELSDSQKAIFPTSEIELLNDYEAAYNALAAIYSIREVEYTEECKEEIDAARSIYNALTDDQKKLIDEADYKLLTDKEDAFSSKDTTATVWGVLLLLFAIAALGCGCFFLYLILRKKNDNNQAKASSTALPLVILSSYFSGGPYLAFYIIISLAVSVWIAVLVIYLLKKKGIIMASEASLGDSEEAVSEESALDNENVEENNPEITETDDSNEEVEQEEKVEIEEADDSDESEEVETETDVQESLEEVSVETTQDEAGNTFKIQYINSFTAKLIQSSDELKKQYSELRKCILSYGGTKSKTTWHYDSINYGKDVLIRFGIRGKSLCVYYALDYNEYENSKYKLENVTSKKYAKVPCLYRIKNDRRYSYAKELIGIIAKKYNLSKEDKEIEDIIPPYEDRDALVEKGLIKKSELKLASKK